MEQREIKSMGGMRLGAHTMMALLNTILLKPGKQTDVYPFPVLIPAFVLSFGRRVLYGGLMISCAFCKFPDVLSVLISTMALERRSI